MTLIPAMAPIDAPARFDPGKVTVMAAPGTPLEGLIEVKAGGGVVTVKVKALLAPAEFVNVTFCAPAAAPDAMLNVAVI